MPYRRRYHKGIERSSRPNGQLQGTIFNQNIAVQIFGQEGCLSLQSLKNLALSAVMTTALGTAMLVTVPQSYADDHAKCQRQIEKEESKLDQAIRKHGEHSRQAEERRRDLNAERER